MRWASTLWNPAKCVTIVWLIQTTFTTMITHVSFTAILLTALTSSCNSLRSGNICRMLQQRNSMRLRNLSSQRWNQATGGGMNRYVSWISSHLRWFWPLHQLRLPHRAMIVPLFGSSDQTHLPNYSGKKIKRPVYLSRGNLDWFIRSNPSNLASVIVALLPIPPKYQFKGHGKTTAVKEQQIHNWEVLRKVFELIFRTLDALINTGKLMLCVDSRMRQFHPVICASTADYFENIHLHSINQTYCPVYETPKLSFREVNSSSWQLRHYQLNFQKMILPTQGGETGRWEARKYLEDRAVGTSEGVLLDMKCISLTTIIVPNFLPMVYLSMLKHLMDCVMSFLEQHSRIDKFNPLWTMMSSYPGFVQFNKPYSQATQWSC